MVNILKKHIYCCRALVVQVGLNDHKLERKRTVNKIRTNHKNKIRTQNEKKKIKQEQKEKTKDNNKNKNDHREGREKN